MLHAVANFLFVSGWSHQSTVYRALNFNSFFGANYNWDMRMMKNIVADTSYKGASNSTHPSASHHHKVNITLFNHTTNGLARFTTMEFNLNIHLKNKHDFAFNDRLSTVTRISAMKLNLHAICWVANHFQ